jgi:TPP-dependent pyruvate/acetoin dehydrogenase alpha subunit
MPSARGSGGIATGAAFSAKRLGNGRSRHASLARVRLATGSLYEVMNLADLWKLPVIYVCENNLYNEYTTKVTHTDFPVAPLARVLLNHPQMNASWTAVGRHGF